MTNSLTQITNWLTKLAQSTTSTLPKPLRTENGGKIRSKYYRYHRATRHDTDDLKQTNIHKKMWLTTWSTLFWTWDGSRKKIYQG